ncbi:NrfD/PsrC family molybdoenzyme membrane anchor subunit [Sutterella sp.]|uniref:NrfD/PsrC family molybdoenzyme membrane anchor subunit n=1 Tax=Sutterella sp. TaxID=1981025 RepID=UPI0026DF3E78|nr:NrfD/PsrC family molybdoenzyme membrane anchor subunit [Sutterella sp.]MDO5530743.1 polysulfide reductase NrfD [Sutterella sp.]
MISSQYMELTAQAATSHWAWTIAFFLWFVGLAGMGLFLNVWLKSRRVFLICAVSAVVGALLVVSHLGRMLNLPFAAFNALLEWSFNFTSWMFIGICLLAVLCIVVVLQSIGIWWGEKKGRADITALAEGRVLAWFDGVLGVAATAYSGFLLTQAAGVPLWNTAALPVLWLFSGLACAVGLAEILAAAGKLETGHPHWLSGTAWGVHAGEAFVIFAFVQSALSGTPGAVAGGESLLSGGASLLFWGGAIGLGILLPSLCALVKNAKSVAILGGLAAILGALALRASVLFAGYFDPVIW